MSENTVAIRRCIDRLNAGDQDVRNELISFAYERLQRMTKKMKGDFDRLGRHVPGPTKQHNFQGLELFHRQLGVEQDHRLELQSV